MCLSTASFTGHHCVASVAIRKHPIKSLPQNWPLLKINTSKTGHFYKSLLQKLTTSSNHYLKNWLLLFSITSIYRCLLTLTLFIYQSTSYCFNFLRMNCVLNFSFTDYILSHFYHDIYIYIHIYIYMYVYVYIYLAWHS